MPFARRGILRDAISPRGAGARVVEAAAVVDPDFASVVLLLDFAGADAATNITDLSGAAHNDETFIDTAQVDDGRQVLGTNSLLLAGTGAASGNTDYIEYPDSADWDFSGQFTVEFHVYREAAPASAFVYISTRGEPGDVTDVGSGWGIDILNTDVLRLVTGNTVIKQVSGVTMSNATWYHIAVTRDGSNDVRFFLDGTLQGTATTHASNFTNNNPLRIGALNYNQFGMDGNIAAVRITKGVARYTANFTPPSVFYPTSGA